MGAEPVCVTRVALIIVSGGCAGPARAGRASPRLSATVIAVLSFAVSGYEARATRQHDRISVSPFLELRAGLRQDSTAGLQLINAGLPKAAFTIVSDRCRSRFSCGITTSVACKASPASYAPGRSDPFAALRLSRVT